MKNQQLVPNIALGIANGDPASGLFTGANFPGASAAQLAAAQSLYAIMTGRVTSVAGNAALGEDSGEYEYLGGSIQRSRMREAGFFVQDSWRVRPNLTVNAGLRYELQYPFTPRNDSYSTVTSRASAVYPEPIGHDLQSVPAGATAGCSADVRELRFRHCRV